MERKAITIPAGRIRLAADLCLPQSPTGLVLFAHGSGSSRHSPRNRHVAEILNRGSIATILADLLTPEEEESDALSAALRFDIPLLTKRLVAATDWIATERKLQALKLGFFGASTGAAAALSAAALRPEIVRAVVSRGGRPDLSGSDLQRVHAPCLFIVGGHDLVVLGLNREAVAQLPRETLRKTEIIPGATYLFEEPGALDRVAELARDWFHRHFAVERTAATRHAGATSY